MGENYTIKEKSNASRLVRFLQHHRGGFEMIDTIDYWSTAIAWFALGVALTTVFWVILK